MKKIKIKKLYTLLIIIAGLLLIGIIYNICIQFKIKNKANLVLEYNTSYQEYGASLKILGKNKTDSIKIKNNITEGKIGNYTVVYSYGILKKRRKVTIVDKIEPELTLNGEIETKVCPNMKYKEEGYTAIDDYDKDLTDKVKIKQNKNEIIYTVKDSSGNKKEVIRKLTYEDKESPKINLKGNHTIYIKKGNTYSEEGFDVTDNCDNLVYNDVSITDNTDYNKVGSYEITYKVKDKSGNETEDKRNIIVYDGEEGSVNGIIYLTFDDGPSGSGTTSKILDILKEEGIKATFFITGNGPDNLIKREFDEGHTIALHSYSHKYDYIYTSLDNYYSDLNQLESRVEKITGSSSKILRFPGGTNNTVSKRYNNGIMTSLVNSVLSKGYNYVDWNVDANDAWACEKGNVTDKKSCVYQNVINGLSKSKANVVLMHDVKSHTADALKDIINYAKSHGYYFDVIKQDSNLTRYRPQN